MKYWALLAGKLGIAGVASFGVLKGINWYWSEPLWFRNGAGQIARLPRFGIDLVFTLTVGAWFLLTVGMLYLCVLDQRYRCRVCLRRLRMPIETGSWGRMLQLGRPRIEYICPYGHGTLKEEELHISGLDNPEWTESRDMWEELCAAASKDSEPRP
jgi:hypothetical protein